MSAAGSDRDRQARLGALLEETIRNEVLRQCVIQDLGLSVVAVQGVVKGVASEVLSTFAVDWSPDGLNPGEVHSREDYSGATVARCRYCLADSGAEPDPDRAIAWARAHERSHAG